MYKNNSSAFHTAKHLFHIDPFEHAKAEDTSNVVNWEAQVQFEVKKNP